MPIAPVRGPRFGDRSEDAPQVSRTAGRRRRGHRRGVSPEERRPMLTALGVLVVVGCALAGAQLAAHVNDRSSYVAVARLVSQGSVITSGDLTTVSLTAGSGLAAVPSTETSSVVGQRASEPLQPGSLLVPSDLTSAVPLPAADALVGTSLAVDQAPAGLVAGDSVIVVLGGDAAGLPTGSPTTLSPDAQPSSGPSSRPATSTASLGSGVVAVATIYAVSISSAADPDAGSGDEIVTLEVPAAAAVQVTAASADSDISLAEISAKAPS
jgi:hypothetical protein